MLNSTKKISLSVLDNLLVGSQTLSTILCPNSLAISEVNRNLSYMCLLFKMKPELLYQII